MSFIYYNTHYLNFFKNNILADHVCLNTTFIPDQSMTGDEQ